MLAAGIQDTTWSVRDATVESAGLVAARFAEPRRVLMVRPSALGDVSRSVAVAASLKGAWPGCELHWLVNRGFEPAIAGHPAVDAVVSFPRRELSRFGRSWSATRRGVAFARSLRAAGYDAVYDVQGLARSGLLTWLTRAPRRVGFADARELGYLGCNVRHRVSPEVRHTVDRMLSLVAADGVTPVRDVSLRLRPRDAALSEALVAEHELGGGYAVIAPTARWRSKCWPAERFAEATARLLRREPSWKAVVLCAPDERAQAEAMVSALPGCGLAAGEAQRRVVRPATDVAGMMALLSRCELLLCNDSAPLHIAVGLGRKAVSVFGPTDPAEVGPYGRPEAVVEPAIEAAERRRYARDREDPTLIRRVEVEAVWQRIESVLEAPTVGGPARR